VAKNAFTAIFRGLCPPFNPVETRLQWCADAEQANFIQIAFSVQRYVAGGLDFPPSMHYSGPVGGVNKFPFLSKQ